MLVYFEYRILVLVQEEGIFLVVIIELYFYQIFFLESYSIKENVKRLVICGGVGYSDLQKY